MGTVVNAVLGSLVSVTGKGNVHFFTHNVDNVIKVKQN